MYNSILDIDPQYIKEGTKRLELFYSNKYQIQAAVLDILLCNGDVDYHELETLVFGEYGTTESIYQMPYTNFFVYLRELKILGAVDIRIAEVENYNGTEYLKNEPDTLNSIFKQIREMNKSKDKMSLSLTNLGLELIRNQIFHSNALATLSTRRIYKLTQLTVLLSLLAIVISIIVLFLNL